MSPAEFPQNPRQHRGHRQTCERHTHMPHLSFRDSMQLAAHRRQCPQYRLDPIQQRLPRSCQLHLSPRSHQQIHPQRRLQLGDLTAQRRLGHRQRLRRPTKMQLAGHLAKVNEVPQLKRILILTRQSQTPKQVFLCMQLPAMIGPLEMSPAATATSLTLTTPTFDQISTSPWLNRSSKKCVGIPHRPQTGQRPDAVAHRHAPHPRGHQPPSLRHAP